MENYSVDCWSGGNECDDSGFSSPGLCYESNSSRCCSESGSGRRGRPKAAMITSLMKEGAESPSGIRCEICCRVFPRDKSLQAHLRVHTGERPYSCDYPGCVRKFKQSGQLKTHQRLHTGERPFLCSADKCKNRFTHANRHCTLHPSAALIRCDNFTPYNPDTAPSQEIRQWLLRYMTEKREPKSEKKTKLMSNDSERVSSGSEDMNGELSDMTNLQHSPGLVDVRSPLNQNEVLRNPLDVLSPSNQICEVRSSIDVRSPMKYEIRNDFRTPVKEVLRSPNSNLELYTPVTLNPSRYQPQNTVRYEDVYWSEGDDSAIRPAWSTPLQYTRPPVKSLFTDSPSPTLTLSPRKRELPKKRWLRIARREEESSANSRRPTVLRYLATSLAQSLQSTEQEISSPQTYTDDTVCTSIIESSVCITESPVCHCISDSSPLLSRLLTMPQTIYCEEDQTPLATPLPHD